MDILMQQTLKQKAQSIFASDKPLPFSVYSSAGDQHLTNVPIVNPLLICVLGGQKELRSSASDSNMSSGEDICQSGEFVFLSNMPNIDMRNISQGSGYFALLIEFQYSDFETLSDPAIEHISHFTGALEENLCKALTQFVEWGIWAPQELWRFRRQELLQLIYHLGHKQVCAIAEPPSMTHKVEKLIAKQLDSDITAEMVASTLALSESTLRRKLSAENTHFQAIKDRLRLGYGLHLLQTTDLAVGLIADQTGYQSQSRFTDKFKSLFGLTPSELRKTRIQC